MDMTWIGSRPPAIAAVVAEQSNWPVWWPDLQLEVDELRDSLGIRWKVVSGRGGRVRGTMELYLHPIDGGVVAYYFLRLDGTSRPVPNWQRKRLVRAYRVRTKRVLWAVADQLDPGRVARLVAPAGR